MSNINLDDLRSFDNLGDLQEAIAQKIQLHNKKLMPEFEGLSPDQMYELQVNFPNLRGKGHW